MTRTQAVATLVRAFKIPASGNRRRGHGRFAAVSTEIQPREGGTLSTFDSLAEAMGQLGYDVLEGLAPEGVYDLDAGEKTEVHVATPIISVSEDQGITINPLAIRRAPLLERAVAQGHSVFGPTPGVEALFAAAVAAAVGEVAGEFHALLFPEQHPEGDPHHDPDHMYWGSDAAATKRPFVWGAVTIEWVADWVNALLISVHE